MHQRMARRLATVAAQKKKAHGPEAVSLWWNDRFGHLPYTMFQQVMDELGKLPKR